MSVDYRRVREEMYEGDPVSVLLKGHLWIELSLEDLIALKLVDPTALDVRRARFAEKVALAQALGGVDKALADSMRAFNRLRNDVAHNLQAAIDLDRITALISTLPSDDRDLANSLIRGVRVTLSADAAALPEAERPAFYAGLATLTNPLGVGLHAFCDAVIASLAVEIVALEKGITVDAEMRQRALHEVLGLGDQHAA